MSEVNPVEVIVERFGSQSRIARGLGIRQSAVSYWTTTGKIPKKHHVPLLALAAHEGILLEKSELDPAPDGSTAVPQAMCAGVLHIGDEELPVYVLNDKRRVISRTAAMHSLASDEERTASGGLERLITPLGFPFKQRVADELVEFEITNITTPTAGVTAEFFLEICKRFVLARDSGQLTTDRQIGIAVRSNAFIMACAGVGLTALIDEATGYQYIREENALRDKLALFLENEMRAWEKTFPDELWAQFGRLTHWQGSLHERPKYWGHYVNELIYTALDPDVAKWLKENAPKPLHGQNYHQWLSSQYGLKKLTEHIWMIVGMARACSTMTDLRYKVAEQFGRDVLELKLFSDVPAATS